MALLLLRHVLYVSNPDGDDDDDDDDDISTFFSVSNEIMCFITFSLL